MKKRKLILPILFSGVIIFISFFTFVMPKKTFSENEKRILAEFPEFTWKNISSGNFGDEFEKYLSDHIAGRDFFVGVNSYFDMLMGKNSLGNIYNCKDGYLINAPKTNSDEGFVRNMNNIEKFTVNCGLDATLMIIPNAGYIMEDKLPMFHGNYRDGELFEKASELTPSVRFFDTRSHLAQSYNNGGGVYYKTDHHITSEGSYVLYREYCRLMGMDYPERDEYTVERYEGFRGTTYSGSGYFLNTDDTLEIWDNGLKVNVTLEEKDSVETDRLFYREHLDNLDMYPVYLDGNHSYVHIENSRGRSGNLLIIRDSYAQNLAPFLAYNYKNIYMLDMRYYRNNMKNFLEDKDIDKILFVYGTDTLLTDESTSWLLF